ncbi:DMT family transporter [Microbacterium sp.]|uniref:DMT family transporter n=1 Tax=Microbacterium sp. TaxID=51671 RepID=UPI003F70B5C5
MTADSRDRARLPASLALSGAVLVGVLTAAQARVNGSLGTALGDGFVAAAISFGSGFVILVVLSLLLPVGRRGVRTLVGGIRRRAIPWWMLAGGAAGAFTVATQGLAVGVIGVSLFTVGIVAGQSLSGLLLDRLGYGPAGVVAVTVPRLIGGALALGAVALSLVGDGVRGIPLWMLLLPFFAGVGIAWQQATNGRLRQRVGTPLTATLVNFAGGSVLLVAAALVHVGVVGGPASYPSDLWLYLGGAIGVVYIFLSAALVAYTGVLLFGLGSVVGQLLTSVVLDAIWPSSAGPGILQESLMASVALVGVIVAAAPWRRISR